MIRFILGFILGLFLPCFIRFLKAELEFRSKEIIYKVEIEQRRKHLLALRLNPDSSLNWKRLGY